MKNTRRPHQGFSMIELLIVVAIIGIISTLAVVNYSDSVVSAARTEAKSGLQSISSALEKCRSLYGSYNSANCTVSLPFVTENGYYSINSSNLAATTFTLTATPQSGTPPEKDTDCTTLTLDNRGTTGATGADTTVCW